MGDFIVGKNAKGSPSEFYLAMANRHGLIAGATGTGKTVSLQLLAENFAAAGISVFTADVKGDLAGIAFPASPNDKIKNRIDKLKIKNYSPHGNAVIFWDLYGKEGHPLRTTMAAMGSLLLSRLLNLNETQQGILDAAFSIAEDKKLLLVDIADLQALLNWMRDNASKLQSKYGNISSSSLGAIQRGLFALNEAGGNEFFGQPSFNIDNWFEKDSSGKGRIHILDATKLINDGRLYSTFLLWLLTDLFNKLPEVGDQAQPNLAFFFDEAHLMFKAAPKVLLEKIELLVRLIRSKGVGVYFITQSPQDIPDTVLGQLGNRIQHALRAFTPKDQKAVKVIAETMTRNPKLDIETAVLKLSVGEALISLLDVSGIPTVTEQIMVFPPESRIGPITEEERRRLVQSSPLLGRYDQTISHESVEKILARETATTAASAPATETSQKEKRPVGRPRDSVLDSVLKSTGRSLGTQVGRQILRGLLGSLGSIFGKKK